MRLDFYMPHYHFSEKHKILVRATPETVFETACRVDISRSKAVRILFTLRGIYALLAARTGPGGVSTISYALNELMKKEFTVLDEVQDREIVLGMVGRFWLPLDTTGCGIDANEFINFNLEGCCKAAWNLRIETQSEGWVLLSTETRVVCMGRKARILFGLYWLIIKPFSGIIRRIILVTIKKEAEKVAAGVCK